MPRTEHKFLDHEQYMLHVYMFNPLAVIFQQFRHAMITQRHTAAEAARQLGVVAGRGARDRRRRCSSSASRCSTARQRGSRRICGDGATPRTEPRRQQLRPRTSACGRAWPRSRQSSSRFRRHQRGGRAVAAARLLAGPLASGPECADAPPGGGRVRARLLGARARWFAPSSGPSAASNAREHRLCRDSRQGRGALPRAAA